MKRPSFAQGLLMAFLLSFFASTLFATLGQLYGAGTVLRILVPIVGLAYTLYLLSRSSDRVGRLTTVIVWALVAGATWLTAPPLAVLLIVHAGMTWLVRSLYFYSSVLPALLDLALSVLGLSAAIWAAILTGSAFLAFWCFFLVQALFVVLPRDISAGTTGPARNHDDGGFQRAYRTAEAAARRLSVDH